MADRATIFDARRANNLRAKLKLERSPFRQRKLINLLIELDDPVVADALLWALENKKEEFVRARAVDGLAQHHSSEGRTALLAAVQDDSSENVRRRATFALFGFELSRDEIESLAPRCLAGDKYQRSAFADLLRAQSDAAAIPPLLTLLEDSKFLVRLCAFFAIRDREDPRLLPALHRAAEREGPMMRAVLHLTSEDPTDDQDE